MHDADNIFLPTYHPVMITFANEMDFILFCDFEACSETRFRETRKAAAEQLEPHRGSSLCRKHLRAILGDSRVGLRRFRRSHPPLTYRIVCTAPIASSQGL